MRRLQRFLSGALLASLTLGLSAFVSAQDDANMGSAGSGIVDGQRGWANTAHPLGKFQDVPQALAPKNPKKANPALEAEQERQFPAPYMPGPQDPSALGLDPTASALVKDPNIQSTGPNGWYPPDPTVAAGPSDILTLTNDDMICYDRDGSQLFSLDINDFVGNSIKLFDPKVAYDRYEGRYYVVWCYINDTGVEATSSSGWLLMYSDNSTAPGNWGWYYLNGMVDGGAANHCWIDYPYLGFNNDTGGVGSKGAICVSGTAFAWYPGGVTKSKIRWLRKSELFAGGGISWWDNWSFSSNGSDDFNMVPTVGISSSATQYILNSKSGGGNTITKRDITNTTFNGGGPSWTTNVIPVAAYSSPPDASQQGSGVLLENINARGMTATYSFGKITFAHGSGANWGSGVVASCKYNRFTTGNVVEVDRFWGADLYHYYYPAFSNTWWTENDGVLVFARSSSTNTEYASIRFSSWQTVDGDFTGSRNVKAGEGIYTISVGGRYRWGDYFGCCFDPFDDRGHYVFGEYAESGNTWGTWLARVTWKPDFIVSVPNVSVETTDTVNLTTTLTRTDAVAVGSGFTVRFYVSGVLQGSATTNASGTATLAYTAGLQTPNAKTIRCEVDDTSTVDRGVGTGLLSVIKHTPNMIMFNRTVQYGDNAQLHTLLRRATDFVGIASATVSIQVNGTTVGTGLTDASGDYWIDPFAANYAIGVHTLTSIYGGNIYYNGQTANGTMTVNQAATTLSTTNQTGFVGQNINLTGHLQRTHDGAPLNGYGVAFTVGGVGVGTDFTDASGDLSLAWTVTAGTLGANALNLSFAGSGLYVASNASATFTRTANSVIAVPNVSGERLQVVNLTATLTRNYDGALIGGRTLNFFVDGSNVGSAVTNGSGVATLAYAIPVGAAIGGHTMGATFAGDATINPSSSPVATLTVNRWNSNVTVSPASGTAGQSVGLSATLRRTLDAAGVAGRSLSYTVNGVGVGSAVTNASGTATLNWTVSVGSLGVQPLGVNFAGDASYTPSSGSSTFTRNGKTLSGSVVLQDWVAATAGRICTVRVFNSSNVLVESFNVTLGAGGTWSRANSIISTGSHHFLIKSSHWLAQDIVAAVNNGGASGILHSLKNGDVDGDNEVTLADFGLLSNSFGLVLGDAGYNANADLNGNDEVDLADFGILSNNFGEVGD